MLHFNCEDLSDTNDPALKKIGLAKNLHKLTYGKTMANLTNIEYKKGKPNASDTFSSSGNKSMEIIKSSSDDGSDSEADQQEDQDLFEVVPLNNPTYKHYNDNTMTSSQITQKPSLDIGGKQRRHFSIYNPFNPNLDKDEQKNQQKQTGGPGSKKYHQQSYPKPNDHQKKNIPNSRDVYSVRSAYMKKDDYKSYWLDCIDHMLEHEDLTKVLDVGYYKLLKHGKRKPAPEKDFNNFDLDNMDLYINRYNLKEKFRVDIVNGYTALFSIDYELQKLLGLSEIEQNKKLNCHVENQYGYTSHTQLHHDQLDIERDMEKNGIKKKVVSGMVMTSSMIPQARIPSVSQLA